MTEEDVVGAHTDATAGSDFISIDVMPLFHPTPDNSPRCAHTP